MTKDELKQYLQSLMGKTVIRKANQKLYRYNTQTRQNIVTNATLEQKVKGEIVGYSARKSGEEWKIKLTVKWESAVNGTIRWNGSKWNTTSTVNLNSLIILESQAVQ